MQECGVLIGDIHVSLVEQQSKMRRGQDKKKSTPLWVGAGTTMASASSKYYWVSWENFFGGKSQYYILKLWVKSKCSRNFRTFELSFFLPNMLRI